MQKEPFTSPKIEYDAQGFTVSFDLNNFEPNKVTAFYQKYGFVIFNNIISEEEAQKTIDELWADIQTRCGKELNRHDKLTWQFQQWKGQYGFVNNRPLNTLQICLNRQNSNVYKTFKSIYQLSSQKELNQPLIAQFDRGSAMRPAKINLDWLTHPIYHFDINPWWWTKVVPSGPKNWRNINDYVPEKFEKWVSEGNFTPFAGFTKLAGVLALSDTNQLSGGFECVPGFHNHIHQWCRETPFNTTIEKDENLMSHFQKIYQRKQSLLIFSRELPHNIYPNLSQNWRFAQYLRMSPLSSLVLTEFQIQKRKKCVLHLLPKELPVEDAISRQIYMLD